MDASSPPLVIALWALAAPFAGAFVLTFARFLGMVWAAPVLGSRVVPWQARIALPLLLALAVTPLQTGSTAATASWSEIGFLACGELLLGATVGFGMRLVLAGLELAAGLIDQQAGLAAAQMLHPLTGEETSPSGALLALAGTAALLSAAPVGGELRLTRVVMDSIRSLPPGSIVDATSPIRLLNDLVLQSFWLGLQVAAPVIVTVGLVQAGIAWAARERGAGPIPAAFTPLRIVLTLLILAATLTDVGSHVASVLTGTTDALAAESAPLNAASPETPP
jgi:flagellar biosynthetic protein FliR